MLWYSLDEFHALQKSTKFFDRERLRIDFVHAAPDCFLDILMFDVPGYGDYFRLLVSRNVDFQEVAPDLSCCFVAVEEGHVAVH